MDAGYKDDITTAEKSPKLRSDENKLEDTEMITEGDIDDKNLADDNDAKDETYVYEDEIGVKKQYRFHNARKIGKRFGMSSRAMTHMINSVLEDLDMDHLYISKTAVEKWNSEDGDESRESYELENQGLVCVKLYALNLLISNFLCSW